MQKILVEVVIALLLEAILEIARNTIVTLDPPSVETSIGPFHLRIDLGGISTWCEWASPQTQ